MLGLLRAVVNLRECSEVTIESSSARMRGGGHVPVRMWTVPSTGVVWKGRQVPTLSLFLFNVAGIKLRTQ